MQCIDSHRFFRQSNIVNEVIRGNFKSTKSIKSIKTLNSDFHLDVFYTRKKQKKNKKHKKNVKQANNKKNNNYTHKISKREKITMSIKYLRGKKSLA